MRNRFLLYIDILGFSDLVSGSPERIDDLYEVIASLNAHDHDAFKCVIFSDTVLVYNIDGGDIPADSKYLLMFLCEFARDLMHRLANRGIVFRAVITDGYFRHYLLNDVPCFYGTALVNAYTAEKDIKAIGLFMHKRLIPYCDIFNTRHFNDEFNFVYVTQALDQLEPLCGGDVPALGDYLDQTELTWMAYPELIHIADLIRGARSRLPESVQAKYRNTIELYRAQYPRILGHLEAHDLDITAVAPDAGWKAVMERYPEDCSYAIERKTEF